MTHDKLLAKINPDWDEYVDNSKFREALRTAVELHKPFDEASSFCKGCTKIAPRNERDGASFTGDVFVKYPCPTIQAIEEQLK